MNSFNSNHSYANSTELKFRRHFQYNSEWRTTLLGWYALSIRCRQFAKPCGLWNRTKFNIQDLCNSNGCYSIFIYPWRGKASKRIIWGTFRALEKLLPAVFVSILSLEGLPNAVICRHGDWLSQRCLGNSSGCQPPTAWSRAESLHNPLCSVFRKGLVSSLAGQNKHANMSVCEKGMRSQHLTILLEYYWFNLRTDLITPHCSSPQDLVIAKLKGFALFCSHWFLQRQHFLMNS